ncbi:hypothetical protein QUF80_10305 [Desulfococcaceae bacterium HSG8]|nr:hypothetical protein [Desulfococcaceae bacterium HSG8]
MQNEIVRRDDPIQAKVREIDQQASNSASVRQSFLRRLLPSKLQREGAEHELRLAGTEYSFREKALEIARDAQLQSIREMYEDFLIKGKTHVRRERAEFVLEQKIYLENILIKATDDFNAKMTETYEKAEKIAIPELKKKNIELIYDTIDRYHALVASLQDQFQNILNEGVKA